MDFIGKKLFNRTTEVLQRSMDIRTTRNRVLSSNIANSETPGFVSKDVPFEKILERSIQNQSLIGLKKTHPKHFPGGLNTEIELESGLEAVNIDKEMAKLAENNLRFQADVQALVKKFEGLKYAIEGGR